MSSHVFFDPTGKRQKVVFNVLRVLFLVVIVTGGLFCYSLFSKPEIPLISDHLLRHRSERTTPPVSRQQAILISKSNAAVSQLKKLSAVPKPVVEPRGGAVRAAFYAPWQETGLYSLRAHASEINRLYSAWLHLSNQPGELDFRDWDPDITPHNNDVLDIAKTTGLTIIPMIDNAIEGDFQAKRVRPLLQPGPVQQQFFEKLKVFLTKNNFPGVLFDFESLENEDWAKVPAFLDAYRKAVPGKSVEITLEAGREEVPRAAIAARVDHVVLMTYDEHWETGPAGPIASADWSLARIESALQTVPKEKLVIGIGSYAYDWKRGATKANAVTFQEAMTIAMDNHEDEDPESVIQVDPKALNRRFSYEDDNGDSHDVWLLDAMSAYNQIVIAKRFGVNQTALWVLGSEDPTYWKAFSPDAAEDLKEVSYPYSVDYEGEGEILKVKSEPATGKRSLEIDPESGLIVYMEEEIWAKPITIKREGRKKRQIALTFDDGPDPAYTGDILNVLKENGVPATFFIVGENAQRYPDLVSRMWNEGHEVGSHTYTHPNLGRESSLRVELELNATQRIIQSILGRSTILFRPPYNADSEPTSYEEVKPLLDSAKLGYVTVGESIDPTDWQPGVTVDHIVEVILKAAEKGSGNCVLLHDAGGDRTKTVAALKIAIPLLKKKGIQLVAVSALMNSNREAVMPAVSAKDLALVGLDKAWFTATYVIQWILAAGFSAAILIGILRMLLITPLALLHRRRPAPAPIQPRPKVTALVAAYNEEKVIVKTLESILACDPPPDELIVIDDGSQDGTSEAVKRAYGDDPRVRLITVPNGGKAAALNLGLKEAKGEILFCIDADTLLAKDAVSSLVDHFADPKVGAVAGNVKVGNAGTMVTDWQSLEYTTSQNLDRRAYDLLDSITVVPGAIGAWRKSAVEEVGGYQTDTLAEDMDLTWRLHRAGYEIRTESRSKAYTEAPETLGALVKQRFRWSMGTFQCLWKHRGALFRYGWFGWLALPMLWIFQVVFQLLAPLIDLQLLTSTIRLLLTARHESAYTKDWQPYQQALHQWSSMLILFTVFTAMEMLVGWLSYRWEGESPRPLRWLIVQRFCYRQLLYWVMIRSLFQALLGRRGGWGKLARTGSAKLGNPLDQ